MRFDRNIMHWFDDFFELDKNTVIKNNFICEFKNLEGPKDKVFVLEKSGNSHWRLEFKLPNEYVIRLKKNVHPIFKEYVYEELSIYRNNDIYSFLNRNILDVFDNVISLEYDEQTGGYYADYKGSFIEVCRGIVPDESRLLGRDKIIKFYNESRLNIRSLDDRFRLYLSYDVSRGEDIIDSLLDLRKSILIMEV